MKGNIGRIEMRAPGRCPSIMLLAGGGGGGGGGRWTVVVHVQTARRGETNSSSSESGLYARHVALLACKLLLHSYWTWTDTVLYA